MTPPTFDNDNTRRFLATDQDSFREQSLQTELTKQLYYRARSSVIGMPACALVVAFVVSPYIEATVVLLWIAAILAVTLFRSLLLHRFEVGDERTLHDVNWLKRYYVVEFFSGLLWSLTALTLTKLPVYNEMFVYLALAGMMMGASMILATSIAAYASFSVPAGGLFALFILAQFDDSLHRMAAILVVLFTAILIFVTLTLKRDISRALLLAYDNDKLLEHVQKANSVLRDEINNHNKTKAEILQANNELARIFEHMQDVYFRTNNDGAILRLSPSVKNLLGYDAETLVGSPYKSLFASTEQYYTFAQQLELTGDHVKNFDTKFVRKDGKQVWVSTNARFYFDENGNRLGIEGTTRDINDNKISANALLKAKEEFKRLFEFNRQILEHAPIGIVTLSPENRITYINPAMEKLLGVPPGERSPALGERLVDIPTVRASGVLSAAMQLTSGQAIHEKTRYRSIFGKEFHMEVRGVPLLNNDKSYNGAVMMVSDISQAIHDQEALRIERDKAEAANIAKTQFIANVTHELRTPLNGIIGMTDVMLTETREAQLVDHLNVIKQAGQHLLELINSVLDLAKIEAGKIEKYITAIDIREFVGRGIEPIVQQVRAKNLEYSVYIADDVPQYFNTDSSWLRQILFNLIGNAAKFTSRGKVSLHVSMENSDEIHVCVADTGIGIPKDKLDAVFQRFQQADNSLTREFGGTGLGAAITKELVTGLGGKIWVESEVAKGSQFHFTLHTQPLSVAAPNRDSPIGADNIARDDAQLRRRLNILVAEDNQINQIVAAKMLRTLGHDVTLASNGEEAYEKLQTTPYDLILMDIQMPVLNGIDLTRKIRQDKNDRVSRVPIVALTAHTLDADIQEFLRAGMTGYLSKPLTLDRLKAELLKVKQHSVL